MKKVLLLSAAIATSVSIAHADNAWPKVDCGESGMILYYELPLVEGKINLPNNVLIIDAQGKITEAAELVPSDIVCRTDGGGHDFVLRLGDNIEAHLGSMAGVVAAVKFIEEYGQSQQSN